MSSSAWAGCTVVIIGMGRLHRLLTPRKYRDKFVTLSEAATGKYVPIPDPFLYTSQNDYDRVMSVIKKYLTLYAEKLERQFAGEAGAPAEEESEK